MNAKIRLIFDKAQLKHFNDWTVEGFVNADPSRNKIYLAWIVNSFIRGGIKRFEDVQSRVRPALEDFMFLRDRLDTGEPGKPWTNERDINNYCGLSGCKKKKFQQGGLETLLNKYSDVLRARQSRIEKNQKIHEDTDILLDDDQVTVYVPKTQEASCYYGQGTKWCTASTRGKNMFEAYNKQGPLYIIVGKDGKKYQMHLQDMQLMDAEDDEYGIRELVSQYPSLENLQPIRQFEFERAVEANDVSTVERLVSRVVILDNTLYVAAKRKYKDIVKIMMQNITHQPIWVNSDYLLDREDGPAVEDVDGHKEWYRKGKLHRLNGPAIENANGDKEWRMDGKLHRLDGPAVEWASGDKAWYWDDKRHREDGPAVERADGDKSWYRDGKLHRKDGPAVEYANGDKEWYLNDKRHREDGPAIENANGDKEWWRDDKRHCEDGPAVEYVSGYKAWYRDGKRHREDGPAIQWADGEKHWYWDGKRYRKDGPAIERADGSKLWYQDDKFHCLDGPAFKGANGDKEWYRNDKLHRLDGPAVERANGDKEWYRDGQRHREDGPAIIWANGNEEWYLNGRLLSSF